MPAWLSPAEQQLSHRAPASSTVPWSTLLQQKQGPATDMKSSQWFPKLPFAGGWSLPLVLFALGCHGWKLFKCSSYLNSTERTGLHRWKPIQWSMQVPSDAAVPTGSIATRTKILLNNNIKMQIMQDF